MPNRIFELLVASVIGASAIISACASSTPGTSGETHFVSCHVKSDCSSLGPRYDCLAQVCSTVGTTAPGDSSSKTMDPDAATSASRGGVTGNESGVATQGCLDLSQLPTTPVVSFTNDIMPIFGLSCVASSCHDSSARKANLILGDASACGKPTCYDPNAKWKFSFGAPIPDTLLTTVYGNLVNLPSKTVSVVERVTPGDPGSSFLIDTLMGTENASWYTPQCKNLDPSGPPYPCGSDMPLNGGMSRRVLIKEAAVSSV